ncbi:MAG: hypothetical protein ACM3U0_01585 [archaeon]
MYLSDEVNPEKEFLKAVLSLAGDSIHQAELLNLVKRDDFKDPFCSEVFEGFGRILNSGGPLNLHTMARHFMLYSDPSTFMRVCREIQVTEYIAYDHLTAVRLETMAGNLGVISDNLKWKEGWL